MRFGPGDIQMLVFPDIMDWEFFIKTKFHSLIFEVLNPLRHKQ